jgi:nitronate monooxygenase
MAMRAINAIRMGGADVLPLVEGGKGVAISNGLSAGHWALAGGVGTFSAVTAASPRRSTMAAPAGNGTRN